MIKDDGFEYYLSYLIIYRRNLIDRLGVASGCNKDLVDFIMLDELISDREMLKTPGNVMWLLNVEFYKIISKFNHSRGKGDCRV